jgi:hypothetical protein
MGKIIPASLCLAAILFASGCSGDRGGAERGVNSLSFSPAAAVSRHTGAAPQEPAKQYRVFDVPGEARIAVLFGYGYNEESFVTLALERLKSLFAEPAEEEIIFPLVFPEDFRSGNTVRFSFDKLDGLELAGLVLLGSPEKTHLALAAFQKKSGGGYPVVSLFPQDDVLGTEAFSDLVFDFEIESGIETEEDSGRRLRELQDDTPGLLERAVYYVSLLRESLPKNADLFVHASQLAGPGWEVKPYIDAETGMHPVNHFVVAREEHEWRRTRYP